MKIKIYDITLSFVKAASLISQSRFRLILILLQLLFLKEIKQSHQRELNSNHIFYNYIHNNFDTKELDSYSK